MKGRRLGLICILSIIVMAFLAAGCATLSPEERTQKQDEIDTMADEAIAELIKENQDLQKSFDKFLYLHPLAFEDARSRISSFEQIVYAH